MLYIVLFVCSCRNENILIIRCLPNSHKNTHRRGVPRGRPVSNQLFAKIKHSLQGRPLWLSGRAESPNDVLT